MTWRTVLLLVFAVGLVGAAVEWLGWEPPGADSIYRRREMCRAVCQEAK